MIFEVLNIGMENAISSKELARILSVAPRIIAAVVERERRAGKPICATCNSKAPGYFIPANREEMEQYCHKLRHRAGEIFATRSACIKMLDSLQSSTQQAQETEVV